MTTFLRMSLALVGLATAALGCGSRNHLTTRYGESTRDFFERQTVNPSAGGAKKAVVGFDTQDAKVVVRAYRAAMSGKEGVDSGGQGFMIVGPQGEGRIGTMPPPSVPTGM